MLKKGGANTLKKIVATLMSPLPSEMKSVHADAKVAKFFPVADLFYLLVTVSGVVA